MIPPIPCSLLLLLLLPLQDPTLLPLQDPTLLPLQDPTLLPLQDPTVRKERERLERIKVAAEAEADRQWREERRREYESVGEDDRWPAPPRPAPG